MAVRISHGYDILNIKGLIKFQETENTPLDSPTHSIILHIELILDHSEVEFHY